MDLSLKMRALGFNTQQVKAVNNTLRENIIEDRLGIVSGSYKYRAEDLEVVFEFVDRITKLDSLGRRTLAKIMSADLNSRQIRNIHLSSARYRADGTHAHDPQKEGVFSEDYPAFGYLNFEGERRDYPKMDMFNNSIHNLTSDEIIGVNKRLGDYLFPLSPEKSKKFASPKDPYFGEFAETGHGMSFFEAILKTVPDEELQVNLNQIKTNKIDLDSIKLIDDTLKLSSGLVKDPENFQRDFGSRDNVLSEPQLSILVDNFRSKPSFENLIDTLKFAIQKFSSFGADRPKHSHSRLRYLLLAQILANADQSMTELKEFTISILEGLGVREPKERLKKEEDVDSKDTNTGELFQEQVRAMWESFGASQKCVELAIRITLALKNTNEIERAKLILGFEANYDPSEEEIKKSRKKLSLLTHPDASRVTQSTWLQKQVNDAVDILSK